MDCLLLLKRVHQQRKVIIPFIIKVILKNQNKTTSLIFFGVDFSNIFNNCQHLLNIVAQASEVLSVLRL